MAAIQAGACFLFMKDGKSNLEELADWAVALEHSGAGERREEGFGEVSVCMEFHARQAEGYETAQ
jgi:hypothetical protein